MFNPANSTEYSRETTVVYTREYPTTVAMFGIGQNVKFQSFPTHYVVLSNFIDLSNVYCLYGPCTRHIIF